MMANVPQVPKGTDIASMAEFLRGKRILIGDDSSATRTGVLSVFKALGANPFSVSLCSNFETAMETVIKESPQIIITDYLFDRKLGLDLIRKRNESNPNRTECLSVLITANSKESSIADAVEEEVDCYILKPFTIKNCMNYLVASIQQKTMPSLYKNYIQEGKAYLRLGDFASAKEKFEKALSHIGQDQNPQRANIFYYLGTVAVEQKKIETARKYFEDVLLLNPDHFKCLTSLFDLNVLTKEYSKALPLGVRLLNEYPVSPLKFSLIVRVVVHENQFSYLQQLYQFYIDMEHRPKKATKSIIAGLVVGGLYELNRSQKLQAMDYFKKAMVSSGRSLPVFKDIAFALMSHGHHKEVENFLPELPPEHKSEPDFLAIDLALSESTLKPYYVLDKGKKLLAAKVKTPEIYLIMIKMAVSIGQKETAEDLFVDAKNLWPERKHDFESVYIGQKAA